jgi:hypothetical protein
MAKSAKKQWYLPVEQREVLVSRFLKGVLVTTEINKLETPNIPDLWDYVKKLERIYYNMAGSYEEYFEFMTEKVFEIMDRLDDEGNEKRDREELQLTEEKSEEKSADEGSSNSNKVEKDLDKKKASPIRR